MTILNSSTISKVTINPFSSTSINTIKTVKPIVPLPSHSSITTQSSSLYRPIKINPKTSSNSKIIQTSVSPSDSIKTYKTSSKTVSISPIKKTSKMLILKRHLLSNLTKDSLTRLISQVKLNVKIKRLRTYIKKSI